MKKGNWKAYLYLLSIILIMVVLIIEILRDAGRDGDFAGYIYTGDLVRNVQHIYSEPLNTWPPFFALVCVPLSWADQISPYFLRLIWLIGSVWAMVKIIDISAYITFKHHLGVFGTKGKFSIFGRFTFVPILISFRYLLDNLANIQINIYMLLLAMASYLLLIKKKPGWAGFLLAFSISMKVYTIFLLFYYVYKRYWKVSIYTIFFMIILNLLPFLVFGYDMAVEYFSIWWHEIASPPPTAHHKNQSVMGAMLRFFTDTYPGHRYYVNFTNLDADMVKKITYGIIALAAIYPAKLFYKKNTNLHSPLSLNAVAFILAAIPILTPLSWKAYFIFLWYPYFLVYNILFLSNIGSEWKHPKIWKGLFVLSVILTVFTTEGIIGDHLSDILESWSCITVGTIILMLIILKLSVARETCSDHKVDE